jgi:hypothetical protein
VWEKEGKGELRWLGLWGERRPAERGKTWCVAGEKNKMFLGAVRGEGELWFPKDERPKGEKG